MPKISISYRRADSEAMTGRIFDRLIAHYGKEAIFRDIDDIPPGTDFRVHINETLRKTHILLSVIGPQWLGMTSGGLERIHEESDPVRVEVETALRRRVPIIPVLIGNTRMPGSDQLPPGLKDFAFRNAVKVDTGQDFDYHMDRLIKAMDAILVQTAKSPPSGETKIPGAGPAKSSTEEKPAVAALLDLPRKKDTGPRKIADAAASDLAREKGKSSFALPRPSLQETLGPIVWPPTRQGQMLRLAIVAVVGVPLLLLVSGVLPFGDRGQLLAVLKGHSGPVSALAFSPSGRTIASGSLDKSIKIWDAAGGQLLQSMAGDSDAVSSVAFMPDGKRLISGSMDRAISIWDAEFGRLMRTLRYDPAYAWETSPAVWSIAVSPDGARIASGSGDSNIRIWNGATGELIRTLSGHSDVVTAVAFLRDNRTLASGSKDGTVRVWDIDSGQALRTLAGHAGQVLAVAVAPDGKEIAAGGVGNTVVIWNAAGQQLYSLATGLSRVESVAFSPDGKRIVVGGNDTSIEVWNVDADQHARSITADTAGVRALAFSPDGHRLASGGDDASIDVWAAN